MDIEEFYDANEQRRESQEIELGPMWSDAVGHTYELNYVVDTGELYLMAMPSPDLIEDPFGDMAVDSEPVEDLTVEIIAVVPTLDEVHQAIAGWEHQMEERGSVDWLRTSLRAYATS